MSELSDKCRDFHITAFFRKGCDDPRPPMIDPKMLAWTATLTHKGLAGSPTMTVPFYTGTAITKPTVADVLSSLLSDAVGYEAARDFKDWCGSYGYDDDSIKARETYEAIAHHTAELREFLGKDYNTLKHCEH